MRTSTIWIGAIAIDVFTYSFQFSFVNTADTSGDPVALDATITPVPEPGTIAMLLTGLLAGAAVRRSVRQSFPMHGAVAA
jgi:hypothetical protein